MNIIKSVRKELNLTQKEFADSLGISKSTVGNYEYGFREPSNQILKAISDKYGYNLDYLITGTGQKLKEDNAVNQSDNDFIQAYLTLPDDYKLALQGFLYNLCDIVTQNNKNSSEVQNISKKDVM